MFKQIVLIPVIIATLCLVLSSSLKAQSREDGDRLFDEALQLQEKARSNEDLKKAVEKYEEALNMFRKIGDTKAEGRTLGNLGNSYFSWGQYSTAVRYFNEALEIARRIGDLPSQATIMQNLGAVYRAWGQHSKALEYFQQSLELSRKIGDASGEAHSLWTLGNVYKAWGNYDRSVEYYEKSLEIARAVGDSRVEGATLDGLGTLYAVWGRKDKAVEYYEMSLNIARKTEDLNGELTTLGNLGLLYESLGQYSRTMQYYEKSLEIAQRIGDVAGQGSALNGLGFVNMDLGNYSKAAEYYAKSLDIARNTGSVPSEGHILINLGTVNSYWGHYSKASEYYETSLKLMSKIGDVRGEGNALVGLGNVNRFSGDYSKAAGCYEKALDIARTIGDATLQSTCLLALGSMYQAWGQYPKALEYYETSAQIATKIGDTQKEGSILMGLGNTYARWGDYSKAVEYYEKALRIARNIGDNKGEGDILVNLGTVYAQVGERENAVINFLRGLIKYEEMGIPVHRPKDLMGNLLLDMGDEKNAERLLVEAGFASSLGRLHLAKADYEGAKKYYGQLSESAEKSRNADGLFTAYTGLATAYEGMGDDKQAEKYFLKAVYLTEDLRSSLPKAQRETFFDVRINGFLRTAPYDGLARVRVKMNRPIEAFKDSEYTKSRIFAESMSKWSESTSFDVPADVLKQDQELNDQLAALKKKRQEGYEKSNQEIISAIEPQVKEKQRELEAHIKMLREKYPLFAATKYPEPLDMNQTALQKDEWVLAYHVTDPGIIIYLTRGRDIVKALYKPISREKLDSLVLRFRKPLELVPGKDNVEDKLKSFDLVAGKDLSDLLLSDVLEGEGLPKNVPVIVVPDDCLGTLPFETLVLNKGGTIKTGKDRLPTVSSAEFFGDRNLISYSQSVTALTLARIHAKSKGAESGLLAIADPVFQEKDERTGKAPKKEAPTGPFASLCRSLGLMAVEKDGLMGGLKFPRLSLTGELGKALAKMHEKGSEVCTGFDASKSNFLDKIAPQLNRYDKVVFATHGYFGQDLPGIMEPVLVLTLVPPGTDGFLRMTEVMGLNMNADIVALTACQTGLGKRTAGEGTMGMGRAFQYAGARSVLMSLWSVSEVASTKLVESFFRNLKEGKTKSQALASARTELRKGVWDHPFFWAGFILVGETN
jgi:tetratricopeptide (TPR) repeat protein